MHPIMKKDEPIKTMCRNNKKLGEREDPWKES